MSSPARSHSAFAIVADGFDRTSFHGFLAKRLLFPGGRLLKHIGVAAATANEVAKRLSLASLLLKYNSCAESPKLSAA